MQNDKSEVKSENEQQQKIDELNEKYLRALADYHNLQKQTDSWREDFTKYASSNLVRKLLDVLDNLEKAQEHLQNEGLKLIIEKLQNILQDEGLEEIELTGKEFDPNLAEVVSTKIGEKENVVAEVLQKGYKIGDKIVRVAKVIVWAK